MPRKPVFFSGKKGVQMKDSGGGFLWANIETSIDFLYLCQRNFEFLKVLLLGGDLEFLQVIDIL